MQLSQQYARSEPLLFSGEVVDRLYVYEWVSEWERKRERKRMVGGVGGWWGMMNDILWNLHQQSKVSHANESPLSLDKNLFDGTQAQYVAVKSLISIQYICLKKTKGKLAIE